MPVPQEVTEFSLSRRERQIVLDGKQHVLREASGEGSASFRNAQARVGRLGQDGKGIEIVGDLGGLEVLGVSICLFDFDGHPVPIGVIRKWPATVVTSLFNIAKVLSGWDDKSPEQRVNEDADAKNSQDASMDG